MHAISAHFDCRQRRRRALTISTSRLRNQNTGRNSEFGVLFQNTEFRIPIRILNFELNTEYRPELRIQSGILNPVLKIERRRQKKMAEPGVRRLRHKGGCGGQEQIQLQDHHRERRRIGLHHGHDSRALLHSSSGSSLEQSFFTVAILLGRKIAAFSF